MSNDFLKKLNTAQKKAVLHDRGPLLIVAGAGTGKTTVLINRLAYLIIEKKVKMDEILLLTFTEKAAAEMSGRADEILPYGYLDLWINTFHGFGERILREFGLDIGLNASFKLLTQTEQWVLIKKNLDRFQLDYYRPLGNPTKFITELIHHFSRLKDENISSEEYLKYAQQKEKGDEQKRVLELATAYQTYNQLLLQNNFLDFGDLLVYTLKLFQQRPQILKFYRQQFKYLMVDEFQDTNWVQYELIKLLAKPANNLVVVGDDDQAIYKFRGASLSNIMQFKDDYPQASEIVLTDNYRSRQEILDQAYHFIQHNNPHRLEVKLNIVKKLKARGLVNSKATSKKLGSQNSRSQTSSSKGTLPTSSSESAVNFLNFTSQDDELTYVVQKIKELKVDHDAQPVLWSDFAILVRANKTAEAYVKELNRQEIPNQFMSWRGLYYKPLILDILAYFRLLDNYHESSALFRVLNMEIFKVSPIDLININKMARRKVWSLYEALKNINSIPGLSSQSVKNINKLLALIAKHSQLVAHQATTKIFLRFAYDSGLLASLDRDRDLELYSYLNQFYQKIKRLEETEVDLRLKDFLVAINLELEAGETGALKLDFADQETVKIMTVHGAKGLEFRYVFIVNLVDKKFPTISRNEKISIPDALVREKIISSKDIHLEEERRLFYVAVTRAKEKLYLTGAKDYGGVREKKPSRFLEEMGLESLEQAEISLSSQNEFLRDLHYLNSRKLTLKSKNSSTDNYPLPAKFSFSQLAAYSVCPLQYKFAFVLKVPVSTNKSSLIFGRVIHDTLYNFLLPVLKEHQELAANLFTSLNKKKKKDSSLSLSKLLNWKRLLALYEEFWQDDGYRDKVERTKYKAQGRQALHNFFTDYQANPPQAILFLEKRFSFRIGQEIIKGAIDRVDRLADGTLEIIDYKTGHSKAKVDKRQLVLYQLFLEEFLETKVSLLSYYYVEDDEKISFTASPQDISKLRLTVREQIASIKKRKFDPRPTPLCNFCDFRDICEFRQL